MWRYVRSSNAAASNHRVACRRHEPNRAVPSYWERPRGSAIIFDYFIYLFIHSFVRSFVRTSVRPSIHPFTCLFVYLIIYSLSKLHLYIQHIILVIYTMSCKMCHFHFFCNYLGKYAVKRLFILLLRMHEYYLCPPKVLVV